MDAITQLTVRAAHGTGNGHLAVLVERSAIQHHQRLATGLPFGQLLRGDMRRVAGLFHQFAKGLGRHMHTGKQLITGSLPALGTAL
ncbi:hypothetical protein D3C75_917060 [compost metagenome]